jgi:hypothetical protein
MGRHSFKYGFDGRFNYVNYFQPGDTNGAFQFGRDMTQGPDPRIASATSGVGFASFLLGTGDSGYSRIRFAPLTAITTWRSTSRTISKSARLSR